MKGEREKEIKGEIRGERGIIIPSNKPAADVPLVSAVKEWRVTPFTS